MLLPDGRVLSAGGGNNGNGTNTFVNHPNAELFSPPYLSNPISSVRPVLTSAPAIVGYGQNFTVATPDAASITRVTLVRLTSVTHSFNQNQRFLELGFASGGSGALTVTAPVNANCPPGQYLLFLLNDLGVPSVGRVITIDASACPPEVTFVETLLSRGKCWDNMRVTASGSNIGATRWFLDGVLQSAVPAGQLYFDFRLTNTAPTATYGLEVTPPCGGTPLLVENAITHSGIGPCTPPPPARQLPLQPALLK